MCLLIGLVFQAIPYDSTPLEMFPLSDDVIQFKTWFYFLAEHLVLIALSYVIAWEARKYVISCKVFFFIQVADLIDYLLTYNTAWFDLVSFNIVAVLLFATSIVYEYGRDSD